MGNTKRALKLLDLPTAQHLKDGSCLMDEQASPLQHCGYLKMKYGWQKKTQNEENIVN